MAYEKTIPDLIVHFVKKRSKVEFKLGPTKTSPGGAKHQHEEWIGYTSKILGPFEEEQEVGPYDEAFTLNIPEDKFPEKFEDIVILEYNVQPYMAAMVEKNLFPYLNVSEWDTLSQGKARRKARKKSKLVQAYGKNVLENLSKNCDLIHVPGGNEHRVIDDKLVGEFYFGENDFSWGSFKRIPFPKMYLRMFGDEDIADKVLEDSKIDYIRREFPRSFNSNGGIEVIRKHGLIYNWDMDKLLNHDFMPLLDNVIT